MTRRVIIPAHYLLREELDKIQMTAYVALKFHPIVLKGFAPGEKLEADGVVVRLSTLIGEYDEKVGVPASTALLKGRFADYLKAILAYDTEGYEEALAYARSLGLIRA